MAEAETEAAATKEKIHYPGRRKKNVYSNRDNVIKQRKKKEKISFIRIIKSRKISEDDVCFHFFFLNGKRPKE